MASSIGHGLVAVALGTIFAPVRPPRGYWLAGIIASVVVDVDAIGRPFGLGDVMWLGGHRAFTHSIPFAFAFGIATAYAVSAWKRPEARIATYLVLAVASHAALDLLTPYGRGVMLWSPLSSDRYHFAIRPLSLTVEVIALWLPAVLWLLLRRRGHTPNHSLEP